MKSIQNRRSFIKEAGTLIIGGIIAPSMSFASKNQMQYIEVVQFHMNMLVKLNAYVEDKEFGLSVLKNAFRRILHLENVFSAHDKNSELNQLCKNAHNSPRQVSQELFEVLSTAKLISRQSNGLFDPTLKPVISLWRKAAQTGNLPMERTIVDKLSICGFGNLILDEGRRTVSLLKQGMEIDLGGIAKGYIGDSIIAYLRGQGINCAACHAGGDIVTSDAPPGTKGWEIDLPGQLEPMLISNEALSISGNMYQHFDFEGKTYGHIIDPKSGQALTGKSNATYRAKSGIIADAKATIHSLHKIKPLRIKTVDNN